MRKEEDNHSVDPRTGRRFRTLWSHSLISQTGKLRSRGTLSGHVRQSVDLCYKSPLICRNQSLGPKSCTVVLEMLLLHQVCLPWFLSLSFHISTPFHGHGNGSHSESLWRHSEVRCWGIKWETRPTTMLPLVPSQVLSLVSVSGQCLTNDKLIIKHYRTIGHREAKDCVDNSS